MLTEALKDVNLTKSDLAEMLNVSRKTIQRMGEEIYPEVRKILNALKEPNYKWLDTNQSLFIGHGRGCPVEKDGKRYVMISLKGNDNHGVVSEEDWKARLDYTCKHGREGWSCKECLC